MNPDWNETYINRMVCGDCLELMRELPDGAVNCAITSPPYWGLRNYGVDNQIGLESSPEAYLVKMVEVFREVRRVLREDGTLWLNLGDSYSSGGRKTRDADSKHSGRPDTDVRPESGMKPKDLTGIPWRVAFALQADGWYLRQDIIWHKPNPMPESVTDRCTKAHEYVFLMSKSPRYYYDQDAIREPAVYGGNEARYARQTADNKSHPTVERNGIRPRSLIGKQRKPAGWDTGKGAHGSFHCDGRARKVEYSGVTSETRNRRSVWSVSTQPFSGAHFATFPPELIKPMILAGCPEDGIVLDPFAGSGTTVLTALKLNRNAIGLELNPEYCGLRQAEIDAELAQLKLF